MKIVLSRKGFDSQNGGIASPIFEDGTMMSLPIPSYDVVHYNQLIHDGMTYSKILMDLGYKGRELHCHVDPDLDMGRRKKPIDNWFAAFGQIGASATYLNNIGIEAGDLFLFFGTFHCVEKDKDGIRYIKRTGDFYKDNDLHVIWGYLQVGEIIDRPEEQKKLKWHPHSNERTEDDTNLIFKAAESLSFDSNKPGAGLLSFDKKRVLTKRDCSKATWKKKSIYDPDHIYGNRKNSAKDTETELYYSGIWQELGLKESGACTNWAKAILSD